MNWKDKGIFFLDSYALQPTANIYIFEKKKIMDSLKSSQILLLETSCTVLITFYCWTMQYNNVWHV